MCDAFHTLIYFYIGDAILLCCMYFSSVEEIIVVLSKTYYLFVVLYKFICLIVCIEDIGHVIRMSLSGYRGCRFELKHQYFVSFS